MRKIFREMNILGDGDVLFFKDGTLHRDGDLCAEICFPDHLIDELKCVWCKNNMLHRTNAPACITSSGLNYYFEFHEIYANF